MSSSADELIAFVAGDAWIEDLGRIGIGVQFGGGTAQLSEAPGLPEVVVPVRLLVDGLVAIWARGSGLREWAQVVLGLNALDLRCVEDHEDGERLLDAIWDAASGDRLSFDRISSLRDILG